LFMNEEKSVEANAAEPARRWFLSRATTVAMASGLAASYGTLAAMMGRFLYPATRQKKHWLLVTDVDSVPPGGSFSYRTPAGLPVTIARNGNGRTVDDFLALSSTCPHLGCRVHWETHKSRFFCPCHNGVFDPDGNPVSGPPADAKQALPRFPLKLEGNLLFIHVATERLA
jgi:Rieske Fe-S protein